MATEFDLRQQVKSLETKVWGLSVGFSVVFGIAGLLVGKFLL
jgi:hypothetical protein